MKTHVATLAVIQKVPGKGVIQVTYKIDHCAEDKFVSISSDLDPGARLVSGLWMGTYGISINYEENPWWNRNGHWFGLLTYEERGNLYNCLADALRAAMTLSSKVPR